MKPTIVAYDGIAVIVNAGNPVKSLTKKQVEQIFTGEMTDWSAVGGSGRQNLRLHSQYLLRHLLGLEGTGDEEARLRAGITEDGGQRADRGGSR